MARVRPVQGRAGVRSRLGGRRDFTAPRGFTPLPEPVAPVVPAVPETNFLGHNAAVVERDVAWGEEHAGVGFPSLGELVVDAAAGTWSAADAVLNFPADTFEAGSDLFAEKVMEPFYEWQPSDWLPEMPDTGSSLPMLNPAGMVKGFDLAKNLMFPLMSEDLDVLPGYDSEGMDMHPNTAMLLPFGGAAKKLIDTFGPAWRAAARLIGKGDDAPEIVRAATSGPVFHGTSAEFETFERGGDLLSPGGGALQINAAPNPDSGLGFHFSTDPNAAGVIGENVMERTIRLDNPLYLPRFSNAGDLRYRAYVSEVGLDDIYEEGYQAYVANGGFTDLVNQGTPAERIMSGRGVLPGSDYGTNVESTYLNLFRTELNRVENIRLLVADHGMSVAQARGLNPYRAGSGVPDLSLVPDEVLEGWKSLKGGSGNRVGTGGPGDEVTTQWVKAQGYDGLYIEDAWMGNPEVDWASSRLGAPETGAPGQRSFVVFDADQIGTALARVGDDVGGVWRSPVADAVPEMVGSAEIAAFDALSDDALITVFHGTSAENAARIRNSGIASTGRISGDLYEDFGEGGIWVSPQSSTAGLYDDEVLEIVVRKGDLADNAGRQGGGWATGSATGRAAYDPTVGVVIPESASFEVVGPALARGADDAATDVVARIEDVYQNTEGKDLFEHYRDLADASGYTDEVAIGQPERYGKRADSRLGEFVAERPYFIPHHSNREDFLTWLQYKTEDLPDGDIHDLMRDIDEYAQAKLFGGG